MLESFWFFALRQDFSKLHIIDKNKQKILTSFPKVCMCKIKQQQQQKKRFKLEILVYFDNVQPSMREFVELVDSACVCV